MIAAYRGEKVLAIENGVESNSFNLLFVLAVTAAIRLVPIPPGGFIDLCRVILLAAFLWLVCPPYGGQKITHATASSPSISETRNAFESSGFDIVLPLFPTDAISSAVTRARSSPRLEVRRSGPSARCVV